MQAEYGSYLHPLPYIRHLTSKVKDITFPRSRLRTSSKIPERPDSSTPDGMILDDSTIFFNDRPTYWYHSRTTVRTTDAVKSPKPESRASQRALTPLVNTTNKIPHHRHSFNLTARCRCRPSIIKPPKVMTTREL